MTNKNKTGIVPKSKEDTVRRRKGEFFTPTAFVDESQKYITATLGPNWREEYVVWDCAWGTGNLTRDYQFNELYCSTLEQCNIDEAEQAGLNPTATKFQFDFLNDDDGKLPAGLTAALNDPTKKILFYINPPYGTAGNAGTEIEDHKAGIANTLVGKLMKEEKWGAASQQLFAQFLYKISKYNIHGNVTIAIFAKCVYKTGGSYVKFRENFYKKFHFENGMLFCASHFADTASSWGVDFSIWTSGTEDRSDLPLDVLDTEEQSGNIVRLGVKIVYNLDKEMAASEWVRQETKGMKTADAPQMSSALKIKQNGRGRGVLIPNAVAYMTSLANSIYTSSTDVFITSSCSSKANGFSVIPANFDKTTTLFAARKMIEGTWVNDKDEYTAPLGYMHNHSNSVMQNQTTVGLYSSAFSDGHGLSVISANFDKTTTLFATRKMIEKTWVNQDDEYTAPLGYMTSVANSIDKNETDVFITSSCSSMAHGVSIIPANFDKTTSLFAAREAIEGTWINGKDEYTSPDIQHSVYQQFVNDSLVYSLFNNSSQQSSMRQVDYKNRKHDIKNEFFWMSNSAIRELAVSNHYDELYRDTVNEPSERFVFNKLATVQLSPDASEVLNLATQLVLSSVNTRKTMSEESPEFHLDSWDAGYAQLKLVWKKFHADEFKKFRDSYKAMEDRMRPLVYELGFLKVSYFHVDGSPNIE